MELESGLHRAFYSRAFLATSAVSALGVVATPLKLNAPRVIARVLKDAGTSPNSRLLRTDVALHWVGAARGKHNRCQAHEHAHTLRTLAHEIPIGVCERCNQRQQIRGKVHATTLPANATLKRTPTLQL